MNLKPLATTAKEGYVKQKQQEAHSRLNVDIVIDEKQLERDIDRAMKNIIAKLNK